jgi:hypothetical protein
MNHKEIGRRRISGFTRLQIGSSDVIVNMATNFQVP